MVNRIALPKAPSLPSFDGVRRWPAAGREAMAWRPPRGEAGKTFAWRALWLPYWIASDVPAPRLPARDRAATAVAGPAGDHVVRTLNGLSRRIWLQRALSIAGRSVLLPLLLASSWLLLEIVGGPAFNPTAIVAAAILSGVLGVCLIATQRPTRAQVARMLDRSFGLHDRMQTAVGNLGVEVPAAGERARVTYLQMADAANIVTELKNAPALRVRLPVREIVLAIAAALLLAALFFLRGTGDAIPASAAAPVPSFVSAAQRLAAQTQSAAAAPTTADAPTMAEVSERAARSQSAERDLKSLANGLADQAVTRQAADDIQQGQYSEGADALREAAKNAPNLSEAARTGLANDLDQAASQMTDGNGALAQATKDAADGLRQGGADAQSGLENLGDAVDQASGDVVPQQELTQQRQQAAAAQAAQAGQRSSSDPNGDQQGSQSQGQQSGSQGNSSQSGQQSDQSGDQSGGGNGADASGNTPSQQGQGQSQDGQNAANSGQSQGSSGSGADAKPSSNSGNTAGDQGQSAEGGAPADANGQGSESDPNGSSSPKGNGASSGPGAGSGDGSDPNGSDSNGASGTNQQSQPTDANAAAAKVTDGSGGNGGPTSGETTDPTTTMQLDGQGGQGVQTSGDNGSASQGAGPGASVSTGTTVQGEVGAAGPDSNRVPESYRSLVEAFFSDQVDQ